MINLSYLDGLNDVEIHSALKSYALHKKLSPQKGKILQIQKSYRQVLNDMMKFIVL